MKVIAKAAGLADWELFSGHSGRVGMARQMAQNSAPTHEIERQGRWKQGGGIVGRYTRGESAGSALKYLWALASLLSIPTICAQIAAGLGRPRMKNENGPIRNGRYPSPEG